MNSFKPRKRLFLNISRNRTIEVTHKWIWEFVKTIFKNNQFIYIPRFNVISITIGTSWKKEFYDQHKLHYHKCVWHKCKNVYLSLRDPLGRDPDWPNSTFLVEEKMTSWWLIDFIVVGTHRLHQDVSEHEEGLASRHLVTPTELLCNILQQNRY